MFHELHNNVNQENIQ